MDNHRKSRTPIYNVWRNMKQRCLNPRHKAYPRYGGRGITVCKRWIKFSNFYNDMGDPPFPGAQLDRRKNNKGYCKNNCRWVTNAVNCQNKRNNKLTMEKARDIRKRYAAGGITTTKLAEENDVYQSEISKIINHLIWKEE